MPNEGIRQNADKTGKYVKMKRKHVTVRLKTAWKWTTYSISLDVLWPFLECLFFHKVLFLKEHILAFLYRYYVLYIFMYDYANEWKNAEKEKLTLAANENMIKQMNTKCHKLDNIPICEITRSPVTQDNHTFTWASTFFKF